MKKLILAAAAVVLSSGTVAMAHGNGGVRGEMFRCVAQSRTGGSHVAIERSLGLARLRALQYCQQYGTGESGDASCRVVRCERY